VALTSVETSELESRSLCSSRKRVFNRSSSMTTLRPYNNNCKASYDVKECSINAGGLFNCKGDCDWEFRFDGKKSKHRVVTNWSPIPSEIALAGAIDAGLRVVHGTSLGARYQYWGGKWHTYLQIGYPPLLEYDIVLATISRWSLRRYLSMH